MINSFYDRFIFTNGLHFHNNNFSLMDIPFVMLPTDLLLGLFSSQDSDFNRKLYCLVRDSVRKNLVGQFRLDFKAEGLKAIEVVEKYFSFSGWGGISNIQVDDANSRAIVQVSSNPFASRLLGKAKNPADHFYRGIFAGLFSAAFGKPVDCVELHCVALGEKDCEFVVKEQKDFDVSKKEVREQLELEV